MPTLGKKVRIQVAPGVTPINDATNLDTVFYTKADKIRFQKGRMRKMGGCVRLFSSNREVIRGCTRTLFTYIGSDGLPRVLIGTSTGLYVYVAGAFYNITPLLVGTTSIANSLSTVYYTNSAYSITTTAGSNVVTFNIPHFLGVGDRVTISGVTGTVGGLAASNFNRIFTVVGVPSGSTFQGMVAFPAISTETAGGSTINFATQQLIINLVAHGLNIGDRIKITGATSTGGIPAASINLENTVSKIISPNQFIITTNTFATSLVTSGGGASAALQRQIESGNCNQSRGMGYGGGPYGVGLYGVPKIFTTGVQHPRIWSMDTFGTQVILTPGGQRPIYVWDGNIAQSPTILTNSPAAVNWVFESNGQVCALGANGVLNAFTTSDVRNGTVWTPGPSNYAFNTSLEGSGGLIAQAQARNTSLLFTSSKVYSAVFVDVPQIWYIQEIFNSDGLIGPRAQVEIEDVVFWQGYGDWYVFNGSTVNILSDNTVKRYVLDRLNYSQTDKIFARPNPAYNEVWWFYPSGSDMEPNDYVIYNYVENHWTIGNWRRTAASRPPYVAVSPLMIESNISNSVVVDNTISTVFYTLGNNPISTTNASATIVITIVGHVLAVGDSITIAGATTTNGIPSSNINQTFVISAVSGSSISVITGANATSTGTGGGTAITVGTRLINIGASSSLTNGSTVTISNANGVGGLLSSNINGTFKVRSGSTTNILVPITNGMSTSAATGGGSSILISYTGTNRLFQHEVGTDDYDSSSTSDTTSVAKPLEAFAETNYFQIGEGDETMLIYSVIPDSFQQGTLLLSVYTKLSPQSTTSITKGPFTITPLTSKVDVMALGRQRKYRIYSNEVGQDFLIGSWFEQIMPRTPR